MGQERLNSFRLINFFKGRSDFLEIPSGRIICNFYNVGSRNL